MSAQLRHLECDLTIDKLCAFLQEVLGKVKQLFDLELLVRFVDVEEGMERVLGLT